MDTRPSILWFDQHEGRGSEQSRRASFLVLFTADGRPSTWLMLLALLTAAVVGIGCGGY